MKLAYDFHLHSCLSPCGDNDMTPYNLVQMAGVLGLEMIALTDHNTTGNCRAAMEVGGQIGVTVVPGMELCTAEEIHVICLFADPDGADAFSGYVQSTLPPIRNKAHIYGEQRYMDAKDTVLGEEPILLVTASGISISELPGLVGAYGGFCYPAHIDRPSYSILATLGTILPEMGFTCAELSPWGDLRKLKGDHPALRDMTVLYASDAHYLENMREAADFVELATSSAPALIGHLRSL